MLARNGTRVEKGQFKLPMYCHRDASENLRSAIFKQLSKNIESLLPIIEHFVLSLVEKIEHLQPLLAELILVGWSESKPFSGSRTFSSVSASAEEIKGREDIS